MHESKLIQRSVFHHFLLLLVLTIVSITTAGSEFGQEHIEPRSGEGACNSAYCPYIRRNSNMADGTLK